MTLYNDKKAIHHENVTILNTYAPKGAVTMLETWNKI